MSQVLAVINQKGGVAKTTTALALGAGLARKNFKTLLIDLDAQGNLSYTMEAQNTGATALDVLTRKVTAQAAIQHTAQGDVIAASPALSGADMVLTQTGKEYRLREALKPLAGKYDYVVIDTPPALGILTVNALTACTGIIIPAQADIYSLAGIGQLYSTISAVKEYTNPNLKILGILLTRHNSRAILSRDIAEMAQNTAEQLGTVAYKAIIRECIALKEAAYCKQDIYTYAPKSNATADYTALVDEVLERN